MIWKRKRMFYSRLRQWHGQLGLYISRPLVRGKNTVFWRKKREKTITERKASRGERKLPAKIDDHQLPQSTHAVSSANHHQMADEGIFSRFIFIFCLNFQINSTFFSIPKRSFSCIKNLKHYNLLLNFPDRKISALSLRKWRYLSGSRIVTDKILYNCSLVLQSSLSARWKAVFSVGF